jgi:hypothetical protein
MSSKNEITDEGAKVIAEVLESDSSLRVLFLHWNKIKGRGGIDIATLYQ